MFPARHYRAHIGKVTNPGARVEHELCPGKMCASHVVTRGKPDLQVERQPLLSIDRKGILGIGKTDMGIDSMIVASNLTALEVDTQCFCDLPELGQERLRLFRVRHADLVGLHGIVEFGKQLPIKSLLLALS
jgi:hypothetical protein